MPRIRDSNSTGWTNILTSGRFRPQRRRPLKGRYCKCTSRAAAARTVGTLSLAALFPESPFRAGRRLRLREDRIFPPKRGATGERQRVEGSFETVLELAGIRDFRFHDLRHTFASWYMMNGGDLYQLAKILGHANIKMTEGYAKLSRRYIATTGNTAREIWKLMEPEAGTGRNGLELNVPILFPKPITVPSWLLLSYFERWWPGTESNRRRQPFQGCALPAELPGRECFSLPNLITAAQSTTAGAPLAPPLSAPRHPHANCSRVRPS
jgi:hypothetical protein